jgi:hypothetical protein
VAAGASPASISARTGVTPCELRISDEISAVSSSVVGRDQHLTKGKRKGRCQRLTYLLPVVKLDRK